MQCNWIFNITHADVGKDVWRIVILVKPCCNIGIKQCTGVVAIVLLPPQVRVAWKSDSQNGERDSAVLPSTSKAFKPTVSISYQEKLIWSWCWMAIPSSSPQVSPLHTWSIDIPLYNLPLLCNHFRNQGLMLWLRRYPTCYMPTSSKSWKCQCTQGTSSATHVCWWLW